MLSVTFYLLLCWAECCYAECHAAVILSIVIFVYRHLIQSFGCWLFPHSHPCLVERPTKIGEISKKLQTLPLGIISFTTMRLCHPPDVPVPSINCCVLNHHNLFYQIQNALALNWDTCCHLVFCLWLLPFHWCKMTSLALDFIKTLNDAAW